jgi:ribosomal protein S18 acetylase RimI-like enzyme
LGTAYRLRSAQPGDLPGLYAVCLKTGDSGKDGTALHDDPTLIGKFFVGPYVKLEPDLAFALEGPNGIAGYLLGARDTSAFNARFEVEWLAKLRLTVHDPSSDITTWRDSDWVRRLIHVPGLVFPPALHPYPAHAHIDLMPEARGHGFGRRMMQFLMARLAARGAGGLHLQVGPSNADAQAFYRKLGFAEIASRDLPTQTCFMGRSLDDIEPNDKLAGMVLVG